MSAGTGVQHSEFNPAADEPVHLYQIWLLPDRNGWPPSYEQRTFRAEDRRGRFQLVASPGGAEQSLSLHQEARIYLATLAPGQSVAHSIAARRGAWLQVLGGGVTLQGEPLAAGDGVAVEDETRLTVKAVADSEILLFDLA